jgi:hypothetical protein
LGHEFGQLVPERHGWYEQLHILSSTLAKSNVFY